MCSKIEIIVCGSMRIDKNSIVSYHQAGRIVYIDIGQRIKEVFFDNESEAINLIRELDNIYGVG